MFFDKIRSRASHPGRLGPLAAPGWSGHLPESRSDEFCRPAARAASGEAAAAPPSSVMKARRFMSDMGLLPRFVPISPFTARSVSAR
jgi:hypothetical protein